MWRIKAVKTVSFVSILIIALQYVNQVIMYKSPYGITQYKGFYKQEKDIIDVLFVGTSHVYSDINPAYIYDDRGILSYDLATGGASITASYYSIEQSLEYQHPDVIALELFGLLCTNLAQRELVDASYGIRNPNIKYHLLSETAGSNSVLEFYMAFPWYHSLYNDVTKNDFFRYEHIQNAGTKAYLYPAGNPQVYKGAVMLSHTTPGTQPDISNFNGECKIDETAEKYLNKIIELCKENSIELCFIISPFYGISKDFCMQINYVRNNFFLLK